MDNHGELFQRLIDNMDNEAVRLEIANTLPQLSLISEKNFELFIELLKKYMEYKDGVEVIQNKWKMVYQNSVNPVVPLSIMIQDKQVKEDAFDNIEFLMVYGDFVDSAPLAQVISQEEGGAHAIANNFDEFYMNCITDLSSITVPCMDTPLGRKMIKDGFDKIRRRYTENKWVPSISGFFATVKKMENYPEFQREYEKYGYLAKLYDEAKVPEIRFKDPLEVLELAKKGYDFTDANMLLAARYVIDEAFSSLVNSADLEEKIMILQEVSKGELFKFKSVGTTSLILQTGEQVVKIGASRRKYEIPYHPRLMMPYFRKRYQDGSCIEVFDYGQTRSAEITDEKLLEIYKELEADGILWGDARKENLVLLEKDNLLPDYIASNDFNVFGFLEHSRYPTNNHKALKKGDIVVCDLDMLYVKGDPNYQIGILDDIIFDYIEEQERNEMYNRDEEL